MERVIERVTDKERQTEKKHNIGNSRCVLAYGPLIEIERVIERVTDREGQ